MEQTLFIGTASWNIPREFLSAFPDQGSHLEKYSRRLKGVEINSSFYKEHQAQTYRRWAQSTPPDFRFAVKLFQKFTHEQELESSVKDLQRSIDPILQLEEKLAVLLIQLPPSLEFRDSHSDLFLARLRSVYSGAIAFEPRHRSWLQPEALQMMKNYSLSKVFADPAPCPLPMSQSPLSGLVYFRLHGSPRIYKSEYTTKDLYTLRSKFNKVPEEIQQIWCIFDNTTYGYATKNALDLQKITQQPINFDFERDFSENTLL